MILTGTWQIGLPETEVWMLATESAAAETPMQLDLILMLTGTW
jgi:hypothetical protein